MKNCRTVLFYGFLVWVIPFVAAIFIFPLRQNERPLFESIMPVVLTLSVVLFTLKYFQKATVVSVKEGWKLGIIWFLVSVGIDLLMFMQGPMKMSPAEYFKDIGLTYLIIPIVTVGASKLSTAPRDKT